MGSSIHRSSARRTLVDRLDRAVAQSDPGAICRGVKAALENVELDLPDPFFEKSATGYARRLLYRSPGSAYSVLVMVWAPGQGTPVHDHAGKWCVEAVHRGEIEIRTFEPIGDVDRDIVRFAERDTSVARPGDVGVFVPPNEYHCIRNAAPHTAITLHVYAGEMLWCHAFHPRDDGTYRRETLSLHYNDA